MAYWGNIAQIFWFHAYLMENFSGETMHVLFYIFIYIHYNVVEKKKTENAEGEQKFEVSSLRC